MASRSDGVTRLYEAPQAPEPERLPQPTKTKDKVLLDERGLLDLPFLALTVRQLESTLQDAEQGMGQMAEKLSSVGQLSESQFERIREALDVGLDPIALRWRRYRRIQVRLQVRVGEQKGFRRRQPAAFQTFQKLQKGRLPDPQGRGGPGAAQTLFVHKAQSLSNASHRCPASQACPSWWWRNKSVKGSRTATQAL